jgi:hypothetical protein
VAYVRTVKTASGATAVQIVHSSRRGSRDIKHMGPASLVLYDVSAPCFETDAAKYAVLSPEHEDNPRRKSHADEFPTPRRSVRVRPTRRRLTPCGN